MTQFDMPAAAAGFALRGGWVIRRLMADLGLTANQAAGIVGNIGFESGGFKSLQEIRPAVAGSRGGYGWAQWTGPRRLAFESWCRQHGLMPSSDEANYGYLVVELKGDYARTIAALKRTATLHDAVFSVGQTYERPGGTTATNLPGFADRLARAKEALAGYVTLGSAPAAPVDSKVDTPAQPSAKPVQIMPKSMPATSPAHRPWTAPGSGDDSEAEAEALNRAELGAP